MAVRRNPNKIHTFATSITTVKNCFEMLALAVTQLRLPHLKLGISSSGWKSSLKDPSTGAAPTSCKVLTEKWWAPAPAEHLVFPMSCMRTMGTT